jgi:hypothetical protein
MIHLPPGSLLNGLVLEAGFLWFVIVKTTTLAFFPLFIVLENQLENHSLPNMDLKQCARGFSLECSHQNLFGGRP